MKGDDEAMVILAEPVDGPIIITGESAERFRAARAERASAPVKAAEERAQLAREVDALFTKPNRK